MKGYGQFCPVAKASEVLGERWTMLIIRELCCADQSFTTLRKGVPLMSPSLLSSRLKSLERSGIISRDKSAEGVTYSLTEAGEELQPVVHALGIWGQRWARSNMSGQDLDPSLLMWDMHRNIDTSFFAPGRTVIQFKYLDYAVSMRFWWLVVNDGEVDICLKDPGHEPDLYIESPLKTMTQIWMGDTGIQQALKDKQLQIIGNAALKRSFGNWFNRSPFAPYESAV